MHRFPPRLGKNTIEVDKLIANWIMYIQIDIVTDLCTKLSGGQYDPVSKSIPMLPTAVSAILICGTEPGGPEAYRH